MEVAFLNRHISLDLHYRWVYKYRVRGWSLVKSYLLWERLLSIVGDLFRNWIQNLPLTTTERITTNWLLLRVWLQVVNWVIFLIEIGTNSACYYYWVECLYLDASYRHTTQALHLLPWFIEAEWSTLDIDITNEEHRINEILYQPGLGLSDHICLLVLCGEV